MQNVKNGKNSQESQSSPAALVVAAQNDGKKHLLLAASGSVATIKLPLIISAFKHHSNLSIRIILTANATNFLAGQSSEQPPIFSSQPALPSLATLPNVDGIYLNADEWTPPWTRNSPILHIELRRWADLLVVAPMSANLLAKVTAGLCDDLLTSVLRAWDVRKGVLVAPAMNTMMWEHPVTARQVRVLREEWSWFEVLMPQVKEIACGDVGQGGMKEWKEIVEVVERRLERIESVR